MKICRVMKTKLSNIPLGRTVAQLDNDEVAAELDRELAQRLGISVEELNQPTPANSPVSAEELASNALLRESMAAIARRVGERYQAKKNADA